jgi:hypothetical protein
MQLPKGIIQCCRLIRASTEDQHRIQKKYNECHTPHTLSKAEIKWGIAAHSWVGSRIFS